MFLQHLVKLPINKKLNNVRFDIDSSDNLPVTVNVTTFSSQIPELENIITTSAPPPYNLSFSYNPNTLSIDTNTFSSTIYLFNYVMTIVGICSGGLGCSGATQCLNVSYSPYCPVTATYAPSGSNFTITLNGKVNGAIGEIFSLTGNL